MTNRIPLSFIFVILWLNLHAQNQDTMVSIQFNAREDDIMDIPIRNKYRGIEIPVSIDSTYTIIYKDSSEMDVVKIGKQISFVFRKEKTVLTGQFIVSPCSLSAFVVHLNPETYEHVVYKVDFFTAYRVDPWVLTVGSETRNLICFPVRFVEPCK